MTFKPLKDAYANITGLYYHKQQQPQQPTFHSYPNSSQANLLEDNSNKGRKTTKDFFPLLILIGLIGSLAVGLGAYGAHVLGPKKSVSAYRKQVYEIANKYQFYHSLALALVPLARKPQISALLFLLGMLLFCGSNYYFALSGDLTYIMLTPTGGVTLAVGWLSLLIPM